jgi:hypothetical protein
MYVCRYAHAVRGMKNDRTISRNIYTYIHTYTSITALRGEKENLKIASTRAQSLGGIPHIIRMIDMAGSLPEEKTVTTFVAYLASRLIELGKDGRAVLAIQVCMCMGVYVCVCVCLYVCV